MLKLKYLALLTVAASIVFGGQALAIPSAELNQYTDSFFWNINPEMRDRSIQPQQTQYQKEWSAIREVLRNRVVWMELPGCYAEPGTYGYEVENYGETVTAVTDAAFYARHPELRGRKIRPDETSLVEEWNSLYRSFPYSPC